MMTVISFLQGHSAVVVGVLVALIDFAIALNPKLESNSIVQAVMSLLKPKTPPQA